MTAPPDPWNGVRVAPSILSADFSRLGAQVAEVIDAGARVIHVDVMDGHFVPPITIGPLIVAALVESVHDAGAVLDVHLMIERPERHVVEFVKAGADAITIHQEATPHLNYTLSAIREAGVRAGLALCPGTSADTLVEVARFLDSALCMTVNPGWGGQPFISGSEEKVARMGAELPAGTVLGVDGGVDKDTAPGCAAAGATLLVAGSAVFGASDPGAAYAEIVGAANAA